VTVNTIFNYFNRFSLYDIHPKPPSAFLLEHDASPNLQDNFGSTALHMCAENGNIEICEMLLQAGANMSIQRHGENEDCPLPIHIARKRGHVAVLELLYHQMKAHQKVENTEKNWGWLMFVLKIAMLGLVLACGGHVWEGVKRFM
jgi:hypothetical protein